MPASETLPKAGQPKEWDDIKPRKTDQRTKQDSDSASRATEATGDDGKHYSTTDEGLEPAKKNEKYLESY